MKRKPIHFYCDLYGENFYFLPGWKKEDLMEQFGADTESNGGTCFYGERGVLIWVAKFDIKSLDLLTHECIHAANYVLGSRGVAVGAKDDEAQAYYVQWIFKKCMQHFKGKK